MLGMQLLQERPPEPARNSQAADATGFLPYLHNAAFPAASASDPVRGIEAVIGSPTWGPTARARGARSKLQLRQWATTSAHRAASQGQEGGLLRERGDAQAQPTRRVQDARIGRLGRVGRVGARISPKKRRPEGNDRRRVRRGTCSSPQVPSRLGTVLMHGSFEPRAPGLDGHHASISIRRGCAARGRHQLLSGGREAFWVSSRRGNLRSCEVQTVSPVGTEVSDYGNGAGPPPQRAPSQVRSQEPHALPYAH